MDNKYLNEWYDYWMIRYQCNKKHRPGGLPSAKTVLFFVHLQGFEPWTNRLRVYCSTNWAKGAYLIISVPLLCCCISGTFIILSYVPSKVNTFFDFFEKFFWLTFDGPQSLILCGFAWISAATWSVLPALPYSEHRSVFPLLLRS